LKPRRSASRICGRRFCAMASVPCSQRLANKVRSLQKLEKEGKPST
jgi:hypothetical protein